MGYCFDCSELQRICKDPSERCGKCWVAANPGKPFLTGYTMAEADPRCVGCNNYLSDDDAEHDDMCRECYIRSVNRNDYEDDY
jgi:hypothetical protein